jgi:diacylglycerol kinase family enzyme
MRHLFIINPIAFFIKGQTGRICREIQSFFAAFPQIKYDIHITRWKRDAVGFTHRYVSAADRIVRVYAVGGMGTLFEVINGVAGLPNVQVACWPFGIDNTFLCYFGQDKIERFRSLKNLVFSGVSAFDLIKCRNNYGICAGYMGLEAIASRQGDSIIANVDFLPRWIIKTGSIYLALALYYSTKKETIQSYQVMIDGLSLQGTYSSILIANEPFLSNGLAPAAGARPDDGILDVYLLQRVSGFNMPALIFDYVRGRYDKWPHHISHYQAKTVGISTDQIAHICIDGEHFYDTAVEYEVVPHAVDFVCPDDINREAVCRNTSCGVCLESM